MLFYINIKCIIYYAFIIMNIKGLSLFANIGVAEAYLSNVGVDIKVANELLKDRAKFYSAVYPSAKMIVGDITNSSVYKEVIDLSKQNEVKFIIATPPCQGMSTAGTQREDDERNYLIKYAVDAILDLIPEYAIIENVPQVLKTYIPTSKGPTLIPDYIARKLSNKYSINYKVVSCLDYGVPQMRSRCIFLLTRKDMKYIWKFPEVHSKTITLREAIGDLPSLDPKIQSFTKEQQLKIFPDYEKKKSEGLKVSKWHFPPTHKFRHVEVMMHTPEGQSALNNKTFYPKTKSGQKVKGFANTYKRQSWDKPAYTITTYNGAVCSQDNVHPGHFLCEENGEVFYSDPRVFSVYEIMILMTLPKDWPIPSWANESLIRHAIGEGIPSLVIKKIVKELEDNYE